MLPLNLLLSSGAAIVTMMTVPIARGVVAGTGIETGGVTAMIGGGPVLTPGRGTEAGTGIMTGTEIGGTGIAAGAGVLLVV